MNNLNMLLSLLMQIFGAFFNLEEYKTKYESTSPG
jgi:hypothetical protein